MTGVLGSRGAAAQYAQSLLRVLGTQLRPQHPQQYFPRRRRNLILRVFRRAAAKTRSKASPRRRCAPGNCVQELSTRRGSRCAAARSLRRFF